MQALVQSPAASDLCPKKEKKKKGMEKVFIDASCRRNTLEDRVKQHKDRKIGNVWLEHSRRIYLAKAETLFREIIYKFRFGQ
jgi:hypothetical protein